MTAVAALTIGARLHAREWAAVVLVCAGLALLGASARGEGSDPVGLAFHVALVIATAVLGVVGIVAGRAPKRLRSPSLGLVAGLEFALVAVFGFARSHGSARCLDLSQIVHSGLHGGTLL